MDRQKMLGGILGVAVGDALGVPAEFRTRDQLKVSPVDKMLGYGTHHQPQGAWSDDSSLTFCLAESLCNGFELCNIGHLLVKWLDEGYWTPYGKVFDYGNTTYQAISKLRAGVNPIEAGGTGERSNGNGSLMRILPVALYFANSETEKMVDATHRVSCLTHAHPRSQMACGFYNLMVTELLRETSPLESYFRAVDHAADIYSDLPFSEELDHFDRLFGKRIHEETEDAIQSSGYVIHTLEASIWSFLRTPNFAEAVLSAVNLGDDTDTTGAVTGGLAGVHYGLEAIPDEWIDTLARRSDILELGETLYCAVLLDEG
ncbi:ADP-ribosylglycohydrolase family protein [Candidatus Poribacteria bacterium]